MIKRNLAAAKSTLSHMVNAALQGKDVVICKDGLPAVRLVPVRPWSHEDPCRVIPGLTISVGKEALLPLEDEEWGALKS